MTPTPDEIREKVAGMQLGGAMGGLGSSLSGIGSSLGRMAENLAKIKPQTAEAFSAAFQNIRETDWDSAYGTFESFRKLITQNFGAFGRFFELFAAWFEMADAFAQMALSDEYKALADWLFGEEGQKNAKTMGLLMAEVVKTMERFIGLLSDLDENMKALEKGIQGIIDAVSSLWTGEYADWGSPYGEGWYSQRAGIMSLGGMGFGGLRLGGGGGGGSGPSRILDMLI